MAFVAKKIFLTKGVGKHRERLSSFELALRNAGIAACNIVRVSSIFPPNCKLISRSEGLKHIRPGQVAFTVISENSTKEPHRLIAASIGMAVNIVLAIVKIAAGIVGNSYALIADGIESTADIVSSLVVWTGLKISSLPALAMGLGVKLDVTN